MTQRDRSAGIVIGKVIDVEDPEKLGRIKVNYPWLSGPEDRWIPVAAPMAGHQRGVFFMPEIEDEVIIAFEQGMWDHPYAIGFLWNPQQLPPSEDPRQRMIRSVNGHAIRFVDSTPANGNLGSLIIEDAHGNIIVLTNGSLRIEAVGRLNIHAVGDLTLQGRLVRPLGGPI